jgi:PKD repeat protein
MTAAGDAIATWTGSTTARVAVAVDDATPPLLSAVTVPPGVQAGAAASMSAAAADAWSPVTLAWDLGDGTTITGDAVSHAYAAAGTKSVTVTATDAAGNAASETRQIVVSPVPVGQDPGGPGPGGGGTPVRTAVTLGVTVPRQSWRAIRKRRAVRLLCTLDGGGACAAKATISRRLAKRLRLRIGPRAKALRVGRGTVAIARGDHATRLDVPLGRKVRRAIGRTRRRVVLRLIVTGSAPGRTSATLTKAMKVRSRSA